MHPIHDVDALLLLALALASKRRPAELVEIMAAIDLLQGNIPTEAKLAEAFSRLAAHGLVIEADGRFGLTPDAQEIAGGQPRTVDAAKRLFNVRENLSGYNPSGGHATIQLPIEQLKAAILAHRASGTGPARNLLVPKAQPADATPRPGQRRRKPVPARRHKERKGAGR